MPFKKIIYKLNNDKLKEFEVFLDGNIKTIFLIKDFTKLPEVEILKLLEKNRKILLSDFSILDIEKISWIKNQLSNRPELFNNLLISKECYLKTWFHYEYFDLLNDLEISSFMTSDDIIRADATLNIGIKLKYFENPDYLLKILDSSLYLKKLAIEKFGEFKFNLTEELNKLITFFHTIKNNLVQSTSIYLEKLGKQYDVVCNVFDNDIAKQLRNLDTTNVGCVSCLDFSNKLITPMDSYTKSLISYEYSKKSIGWMDAIKIRNIAQELNLDEIIITDIEKYTNFNEIKVCSEYGFNKIRTNSIQSIDECDELLPLYKKFKGWNMNIHEVENERQIPYYFLSFLSELRKMFKVKEIVVYLKNFEVRINDQFK